MTAREKGSSGSSLSRDRTTLLQLSFTGASPSILCIAIRAKIWPFMCKSLSSILQDGLVNFWHKEWLSLSAHTHPAAVVRLVYGMLAALLHLKMCWQWEGFLCATSFQDVTWAKNGHHTSVVIWLQIGSTMLKDVFIFSPGLLHDLKSLSQLLCTGDLSFQNIASVKASKCLGNPVCIAELSLHKMTSALAWQGLHGAWPNLLCSFCVSQSRNHLEKSSTFSFDQCTTRLRRTVVVLLGPDRQDTKTYTIRMRSSAWTVHPEKKHSVEKRALIYNMAFQRFCTSDDEQGVRNMAPDSAFKSSARSAKPTVHLPLIKYLKYCCHLFHYMNSVCRKHTQQIVHWCTFIMSDSELSRSAHSRDFLAELWRPVIFRYLAFSIFTAKVCS